MIRRNYGPLPRVDRRLRVFAIVDAQDPQLRYVSHVGTHWRDDPTAYDPAGELLGGRPWPARMVLTFSTHRAAAAYLRGRGCHVTARAFYIRRIV